MAKSKSGGTRSYLRGRVGADVYSVGKDGKGKKQQVVRSLAETVANPQTTAQMRGRMIMSTVMQAQSGLVQLINHSFDNVVAGQPSISEFIRRNYALVKADAAANSVDGNYFGLNKYGEKGVKGGQWVIAAGQAVLPSAVVVAASTAKIALTSGTLTVGGLKAALGISGEEYITIVQITEDGEAVFVRLYLSTTLADSTAISSENVASLFTTEGNTTATIALSSNDITITLAGGSKLATGAIISKKQNGKFIHNDAAMTCLSGQLYPESEALPTYPTGTEKFLNGGDL